MDRTQKQEVVDQLRKVFTESSTIMLIDFTGISVAEDVELRRSLSPADGYRVVKNTLALRAAADTTLSQLESHFNGPTAVAFTQEDPVGLAKSLRDFLKSRPGMSFKAAVVDQQVLTAGEVVNLAGLPGRAELLVKFLSQLNAPLSQFAGSLQSPLRSLASILKQVGESKGK